MKFLHLADLHIGKRLHGYPLAEDQRFVLEQLCELARTSGADAVLVSGDVYDRALPSPEAVSLASSFFTRLAGLNIPVFVIAGNHDAPERIDYFSPLLAKSRIYMAGVFSGTLPAFTLSDEHGPVTVVLMPFLRPLAVRRFFPDETIDTYADALRVVLGHTPLPAGGRSVLLAHQFVAGAAVCDSEEGSVGGLDQVPASLFDAFDYVALGHLHGPQRVGRDTVRYAGSPLKYSFSEKDHHKSVPLVTLGAPGECSVELLPVRPLHEVREVKGTLGELCSQPGSDDYIRAVVTDDPLPTDALATLRTVYPNLCLLATPQSAGTVQLEVAPLDAEAARRRAPLDWFIDFYSAQNGGERPDEARLALMRRMIEEAMG